MAREKMKQIEFDCMPFVESVKQKAQLKRKWENAFQKWCDEQSQDGTTSLGICGYGSICNYCEDNTYGKPCVRALNAMCRQKGKAIDYSDNDFESFW